MKVEKLSGALLDYWVLRAEGWVDDRLHDMQLTRNGEYCIAGVAPKHAIGGHCWRSPSTDWAVGGPLIEREGFGIAKFYEPVDGPIPEGSEWGALMRDDSLKAYGSTPLIAAMRLLVRCWFGEEVPDA